MKRFASFDNAWFVTLLFTAMAMVMTWPLARTFTSEVAWDLGDPVLNCWIMMWTGGQVLRFLKGDVSALGDYWNGNMFYPERLTIAYSEHLTPQMLQILPVYAVTGNIVLCYNLLFLSALVLCGLGMYLFVREITGQPVAAFVAGAAFAFAPYRVDQFAHLQVMSSQWMPLAFYGFRRYFAGGRVRALVGASAAVVVQILSCGYYLFYFTPFAAAYALYEMIAHGKWRSRRTWIHLAIAGVVSGLCVIPFLIPYLRVRDVAGMGVRSLAELASFSADTWALATASENLTFWGPRLQTFVKAEGSGFPGLTMLLLGVAGIVAVIGAAATEARRRAPRHGLKWRVPVGVVVGAVGALLLAGWVWMLVWAGGTTTLAGMRLSVHGLDVIEWRTIVWLAVTLALFPGARAFFRGRPQSAGGFLIAAWILALFLAFGPTVTVQGKVVGSGPYRWLFDHVPGFNGMRVPARFFMIATMCLSAIAGLGMAAIIGRWRRAGYAVAVVAIVAIGFDGAVSPFITNKRLWVEHFELESRDLASASTLGPVYNTVRDLPVGTVLAEFPFGSPPFDIRTIFFAGFHRKPVLNGYSGYFPDSFNKRMATLAWDPTEDAPAAWKSLGESGATHVVVHESAYTDEKGAHISSWLRSEGARELAANGTDHLFALK